MAFYETVFIARQDLSEAQVKTLTEEVSKIITTNKGKILKTESWGLRTLAYRINKNKKGHYVLIEHDSETSLVAELERLMRLDENILRYMTVRMEAASKDASAILRSSDREEGRGPRDTGYRSRRPSNTEQEAA